LSAEDIKWTYSVRAVLEAASAREAARNFDEARGNQLSSILQSARAALEARDGIRLAELNRSFHLTGHAANGNPVLLELIDNLTVRCQRYRLTHAGFAQRSEIALYEHEAILEAWIARDPIRASRAVEMNLRNSESALLASLANA
jgi:DNA-binding GntR family transcriptional regulator